MTVNEILFDIFNATERGALHRALRVPAEKNISLHKLTVAMTWTGTERRERLALKAALTLMMMFRRAAQAERLTAKPRGTHGRGIQKRRARHASA